MPFQQLGINFVASWKSIVSKDIKLIPHCFVPEAYETFLINL